MEKFEELALLTLGADDGVPMVGRIFQGDLEDRGENDKIRLPTNGSKDPIWKKFGIIYGEKADELFRWATVPKGWKIERTGHYMYSDLLDDKGRKRALIMYKGMAYDRCASISPNRRFRIDRIFHPLEPLPPRPEPKRVMRTDLYYVYPDQFMGGWPRGNGQGIVAYDKKGRPVSDDEMWKYERVPEPPRKPHKNDTSVQFEVKDGGRQVFVTEEFALPDSQSEPKRHHDKLEKKEKILREVCLRWLAEQGYTDIDDFAAYWD